MFVYFRFGQRTHLCVSIPLSYRFMCLFALIYLCLCVYILPSIYIYMCVCVCVCCCMFILMKILLGTSQYRGSNPHLIKHLIKEVVGQVLRSQQIEMGLLEQLNRKRRIGFSIIMYKSSGTFMKGCTKFKPHKRRCEVKLVRHV